MGSLASGTITFRLANIGRATQLWQKQPEAMKSVLDGE